MHIIGGILKECAGAEVGAKAGARPDTETEAGVDTEAYVKQ